MFLRRCRKTGRSISWKHFDYCFLFCSRVGRAVSGTHATIGTLQPNSGNVHVHSGVCGLCLICTQVCVVSFALTVSTHAHICHRAFPSMLKLFWMLPSIDIAPQILQILRQNLLGWFVEGHVSTKTFWTKTPEVLESAALAWHSSSLSPAAAHFRQVCSRRSCWTFFDVTSSPNSRTLGV